MARPQNVRERRPPGLLVAFVSHYFARPFARSRVLSFDNRTHLTGVSPDVRRSTSDMRRRRKERELVPIYLLLRFLFLFASRASVSRSGRRRFRSLKFKLRVLRSSFEREESRIRISRDEFERFSLRKICHVAPNVRGSHFERTNAR